MGVWRPEDKKRFVRCQTGAFYSAGHYLWCSSFSPRGWVVLSLHNHSETSVCKVWCSPQCGTECNPCSWEMCYYNNGAVLWSSEVLITHPFSKEAKKYFFHHFKRVYVCTEKLQHRSFAEVACFACLCFRSIFMHRFLFKVLNSTTCFWNCAYPES